MKPLDPRVRSHLAPARAPLLGVGLVAVLGAGLVIAQAWVLTGLVLAALDDEPLLPWAAAVLAVLVGRGLSAAAGDVLAARSAAVVGTRLRHRLVAAATRRRTGATGEVAALATRGVAAAEPYLTRYLPALVLAAVLPPLTVVAIATQDLLSAVIVLATLPLVPVFGALVGLATRDRAEEQWRALASLSGHFLDVMRGLPTLVVHRRARAQSGRIAQITERYRVATVRTLRIAFASSMVLELVATLSVALVAVTVGVRLAQGSVGLSTALVVLLLAPEAYWPLRRVGAEFHAAAEGAATFEAAHAVLAGEPRTGAVGEPRAADPAAEAGDGLVLRDVTIAYPERDVPAVRRLSARIPPRGVTVLTGPSGCGKSTVLAALAGLRPVTVGTITVDGHPVGGAAWQEQVAWLPQQPQFLQGSIADNLRLADPQASGERLWEALRSVALEERVRALPQGLDEPLGEDGATLSAGERARLALARIVLADRPWMLLDEPTAHLDPLTEQVIADTVVALGRRGGVVVVAHRPAMVSLADHRVQLPAAPGVPEPAGAVEDPRPAPRVPVPESSGPRGVPMPEAPVRPARRGFLDSTVLGALASASGVALTATAGWLIVQASTQPPVLTLLVAIVGVRAFGLARPVLRYAERLRSHDAALALLARRRVEVYDAVVPLVPARLGRRRGDVLSSIVDDVDSVVDQELRVRMPVRQLVVVAVVSSVVAAILLPAAGLVLGAFCAVAGAGAYGLAHSGASRSERRAVALRAGLSDAVVEQLRLADELRMWQAVDRALLRVDRFSDRIGAAAVVAAAWAAGARLLVLTVSGLAVGVTAWFGAAAAAAGSLSGPMLALLGLLPVALIDVLLPVADAGALAVRTRAAADRLRLLEAAEPAVRDTGPAPLPVGHDVAVLGARARWDEEAPLTPPVDLFLEPGERVGVVGPSGSGKSTLAALLLRFLDPVTGSVRLGGTDVPDLSVDDLRSRIGLVDDSPHVFATTLVENVRLARPQATDAEVETAIRRARLGGWLDSLPDGLHTWLGDGHADVSGGERARLGIARSLLAAHPVLVLDEPTAHLDHATAAELAREVLADTAAGPAPRSVVWITHDPVGLELVHRVVDLGLAEAVPRPLDAQR